MVTGSLKKIGASENGKLNNIQWSDTNNFALM